MNRYHGNGITNEQEKILDFTGGEKKKIKEIQLKLVPFYIKKWRNQY